MKEDKYSIEVNNLCKAIDIAINSFKKFPPKIWDEKTLNHFISCYEEWKRGRLNAEKKFRTLSSLKYEVEDVFTYFQESAGDEVNYFWKKIKEQDLPYKRENKMLKILKRKKINNDIEYDFVIDVIVPYRQEGMITDDEVGLLNNYIAAFENKKRKSK